MIRGNIFAALFSMLLVLPVVFWTFDRQLPLQLSYVEIVPPEVTPGQEVEVHWTAKKIRKFGSGIFDCHGTFTRRITDATGVVFETKPLPITAGTLLKDNTEGTFAKKFIIPVLLPGPATYQITTSYACNPMQWFFPIVHKEDVIHFHILAGQTNK